MTLQQGIGEMEIDDLEAKWERQWDYDDLTENYECNMEEGDNEISGCTRNPSIVTGGTSPVHMDLFYDENGCSGPMHDAHSSKMLQHAS